MNNAKLLLGISTTAIVLLLGVIVTPQISKAQPSNATAAAPSSVNVHFFDTRNNAKYAYELPVDNQLQTKMTNLIKNIIGSESLSGPAAAQDPTQNALIANATATVASAFTHTPGPQDVSPSSLGSWLKKGLKIAEEIGPIALNVALAA